MEENKFWAYIWTLVAIVIAVIVIAISASTAISDSNRTELIDSALAHGQDPVTAVCAYDQPQQAGPAALCVSATTKATK